MNIQDSLDKQSSQYNLSSSYGNQSPSTKLAMQNLYRQQLDQFLLEKNKQKQRQKLQKQADRKQFNDRANNNKESEKMKQIAYKNYYNMLVSNQEQLQSSYVSPYSIRDKMKDSHINHTLEEGQRQRKLFEAQQRRKQLQRKNNYRNELMKQLQQKQKTNEINRLQDSRTKQQYRKYGQLPLELQQYQKKKHKQQMAKYRQDLDKVREQQQYMKKRSLSQRNNKFYAQVSQHNAIVNPMPFNIQNPYILKQMNQYSYNSPTNQRKSTHI